jgi:ABC-type Mn2+/Zn2+ transport system ATPase subunit
MTAFDAASLQFSSRVPCGWLGRKGAARVAASLLELSVGHLRDQRFSTLSGGQQQRVMLAGALAADPNVLVLDEPTEGLDLGSRRGLLDLLTHRKRSGLAIILVSHELEDLIEVSDAVAWLHPGDGPDSPSQVEWTTAHEVSARLARAPAGLAFRHEVPG